MFLHLDIHFDINIEIAYCVYRCLKEKKNAHQNQVILKCYLHDKSKQVGVVFVITLPTLIIVYA